MFFMLKYRRGHRPRGSWRYPLQFTLGAFYTPEEIAELSPDWQHTHSEPLKISDLGSVGPNRRQSDSPYGVRVSDLISAEYSWVSQKFRNNVTFRLRGIPAGTSHDNHHMFFSHEADREHFILILHRVRATGIASAQRWWEVNAPSDGDGEETVLQACVNNGLVKTDSHYPGQAVGSGTYEPPPVRRFQFG